MKNEKKKKQVEEVFVVVVAQGRGTLRMLLFLNSYGILFYLFQVFPF